MPTLTETTSPNGKAAVAGSVHQKPAGRAQAFGRRRQVPWIVAGVLLVVGSALAFGVASIRLSHGEEVLAVARPVAVGQVIRASDLRAVRVTPAGGLTPMVAASEASVLGHPAAVALVPGTLITPADLGTSPLGGGAFDVVAMALKAGAYPPSLGPGEEVEVVPVVASGTSSAGAAPVTGQLNPVRGVVAAVDATPAGSSADAVVSLDVSPSDAAEVAWLAAAGQAAVIELPAGSAG